MRAREHYPPSPQASMQAPLICWKTGRTARKITNISARAWPIAHKLCVLVPIPSVPASLSSSSPSRFCVHLAPSSICHIHQICLCASPAVAAFACLRLSPLVPVGCKISLNKSQYSECLPVLVHRRMCDSGVNCSVPSTCFSVHVSGLMCHGCRVRFIEAWQSYVQNPTPICEMAGEEADPKNDT